MRGRPRGRVGQGGSPDRPDVGGGRLVRDKHPVRWSALDGDTHAPPSRVCRAGSGQPFAPWSVCHAPLRGSSRGRRPCWQSTEIPNAHEPVPTRLVHRRQPMSTGHLGESPRIRAQQGMEAVLIGRHAVPPTVSRVWTAWTPSDSGVTNGWTVRDTAPAGCRAALLLGPGPGPTLAGPQHSSRVTKSHSSGR